MAKKSSTLKIKYVKSSIGCSGAQKAMVRGLGLRRLNQVVERPDTPSVRGVVNKIGHLVEVIEGDEK